MPGLSFLFKKPWHPARQDNQKQVFIKESTAQSQLEREAEAAKEVAKEEEMRSYERVGDLAERDPRTSSLKFMYAQPKADGDSASSSKASAPPPPVTASGEDDDDVRQFWLKLKGDTSDIWAGPKNVVRKQSALEKQLGIRTGEYLNRAQLEERHPRLKNAPVEGGAYTAHIQMNHKPFNDVVRNVKCVRCGEWGHIKGDRECSLLHEVSASDLARQRQEDPLNAMKRDEFLSEKQKLILCKAVQPKRMAGLHATTNQSADELVESDEEGESDPEGDFLATLSRREKKLLLRKLKMPDSSSSDSSSSDSSSSDSDSSSVGDNKHQKRRQGKNMSSSNKGSSKKIKKRLSEGHADQK
ncbi:unnamed protein product, partial [Ectocarpus fasciculatus]